MRKAAKLFTASLVLLLSAAVAFAQNITVKGTVSDAATGEPLPGAMVIVQGTSKGVSVQADGSYSISVPANATLQFSLQGYLEQIQPVNGQASINVALSIDSQLLEETIIIGYGTSTKSSFTGSAAMVKSDAIEKKVATSVTSALAGATAGVQMYSSSGDPASGSSGSIRIRGFGSMSASNAPLIILDGTPYDGAISDINPNDVESMTVLKDASAAAIYGNRGANGVVLITTKKGNPGEAQVRFDGRFGVNTRLIPQYDVITEPGEYYETWYKLLYNQYLYAGHTPTESYAYADANLFDKDKGGLGYQVFTVPQGEKLIGTNFKLNPNATLGYSDGDYYYTPDDWYNETFHTGYRQEYNVSASGATQRFNYYASAGFLNNGGIIDNSGYKRYTGRVNAEYQAKDWIRLNTSMSFTHTDSESVSGAGDWGSSGNLFYIVNNIAPIYPLYVRKVDANGKPYLYKEDGRQIYDANQTNFQRPSIVGNAVRDNKYNDSKSYRDEITGKWGIIATPLKGLSLTANVAATAYNGRGRTLGSPFASASSVEGSSSVSHARSFYVNQQYLADYKVKFAEKHSLDLLLGFEQYKVTSQSLSGYNDHLFNPLNGELNNADGTKNRKASSSTGYYMTQGVFSRLQYDFAGKYFLSASLRRDASSRFAEGHRWGNFWSAGLAWLVSEEGFLKDASWVDMLKFKVSYGSQGNDDIGGSYPYADQYSHSYDEDKKAYSVVLDYKGNKELTWETNNNFNVGTDFELLHGYLNGTLDLFARKTVNLLYSRNVPLSAGNPTGVIPVNVGSMLNSGFELTLDGLILNTKHVNWTWNANISHYKNKILELDSTVPEEGLKGSNRIIKEGGSLYDAYLRKYAGVDKATGKALYWHHVDQKDHDDNKYLNYAVGTDVKTSTFSEASQYNLGTILPKVYGGFGTTVNAFGFDFSIQCAYQLGGKYYDGTYQTLMMTDAANCAGQNIHRDILKSWTPENPDSDIPRMDGNSDVAQTAVDRFLVSSNYLSINNATLGYTLPASLVSKAKLASVRIYVAGDNIAVLSARKGIDPRFSVGIGSFTSGSGINSSSYSALRTLTGGITITF
ncbi:MAG: SusC/RagA family TonB-linked outer membrane protein [Bacteroidales bacterium]|nr:SusC/RagA family TonB-linked outer membrane protein [Bacteroidales bacterium]